MACLFVCLRADALGPWKSGAGLSLLFSFPRGQRCCAAAAECRGAAAAAGNGRAGGSSRRRDENRPRTWGLFDEGEYHRYLPKKQPPSPEGGNHRVLYHGTSVACLVGILEDGLAPSSSGLLGPGIYLGGRPKAERYFRNPDAGVLLECQVALGRVLDADVKTYGVPAGYGSVRGVPGVTLVWQGTLREEEFIVRDKSQIAICAIWLFKGPENTCSQCGKSFFRSELRVVDYYRRYCAACMK